VHKVYGGSGWRTRLEHDAQRHEQHHPDHKQLAAHAITSYFLANADAGNHAANDELIAELAAANESEITE